MFDYFKKAVGYTLGLWCGFTLCSALEKGFEHWNTKPERKNDTTPDYTEYKREI